MAEIKQELVLEDGFSKVLDNFIYRLQYLEKAQEKLIEQYEQSNDLHDKQEKQFDQLDRAANRFANNGLNSIWRKLIAIGTAYLGFNAIKRTAFSALEDIDSATRLANNYQVDNASGMGKFDFNRKIGNMYGMSTKEALSSTQTAMRVTTDLDKIEKMYNLGARLASINPNVSVSQATSQLASGIKGRDVNGILDSMGLEANMSERFQMNRLLKRGDYEEVLKILDEMANKAGATQKALDNMLNSPLQKINRIQAIFKNSFDRAAQSLIQGLKPAIDFILDFVQSSDFEMIMDGLTRGFYTVGNAIGFVARWIIQNRDAITEAMKKIAVGIGIVIGVMGALKIATIAATIAQWNFNAAAWANPVGLITLAVVGAIAAFTALTAAIMGCVDKSHSYLERLVGSIFAIGSVILNTIITPLNQIILYVEMFANVIIGIVNFFANVWEHPLEAIKMLFFDVFEIITEIVGGTIQNISDGLDKLIGKIPVLNKLTKGGIELGKDIQQFGKDKNEEALDKAMANGYRRVVNPVNFKQFEHIDLKKAYEFGANLPSELKGKFDSIISELTGIKDNTGKTKDGMYDMINVLDPDAWMDKFGEFAVNDAEYKKMMNVNESISISPTFNITGAAAEKIDERKLNKMILDGVNETIKNQSRVPAYVR